MISLGDLVHSSTLPVALVASIAAGAWGLVALARSFRDEARQLKEAVASGGLNR